MLSHSSREHEMPLPSRPKDGGISFLAHPPRTPASVLWQQSCRSLGRERVWFHPPNASHGPTFYHLVPLTSKPFWLWIVPKYIVKATLIKQLGGIPLKKKKQKTQRYSDDTPWTRALTKIHLTCTRTQNPNKRDFFCTVFTPPASLPFSF